MTLTPELAALLKSVAESQEQISNVLLKMNETPNVATPAQATGIEQQSVPAPATRRYITPEERGMLSDTLRPKSVAQISELITRQAAKSDTGIPLDLWLNTAGFAAQNVFNQLGSQLDPDIAKALDTGAVTALIRQDLEPMLYEIFIRLFPAYDRMPKEPANGLLHAWNQITAYGDAKFMAELGTVTDDSSTFHRESTNVAILATRRGISLKSQFAVMAGGMNYNPEAIEMQGGLRAMAHKMQKTIFEGQATVTSGTADTEDGLYDTNAFTGLRSILNTSSAVYFDPATNPTTTGSFRRAVDAGLLPVTQSNGMTSVIWGHPQEKITFDEQQDPNVRLLAPNYVNIGVGAVAQSINTYAGPIPFAVVPGDSINSYHSTANGSSILVRDMYMLDEGSVSMPYLGSPGPTVLDIPIGISGQLTHLFIIFMMNGFSVKVLPWNNKLRVKVTA